MQHRVQHFLLDGVLPSSNSMRNRNTSSTVRACKAGIEGMHDPVGVLYIYIYMGVSKNNGTPKSSILIGFSIINHPFWSTPIFGNPHIYHVHI